ncbi:hypothetical protein HK100_008444 [Physocladia obscura]|uniref:Uncharacterized protein n=1 Tax=Physocladia obscura TaxID=109957 RepID=A0AAD5T4S5_9FUNG|nr:hypothetical protein HK100_008444 [Physocladia obscura]
MSAFDFAEIPFRIPLLASPSPRSNKLQPEDSEIDTNLSDLIAALSTAPTEICPTAAPFSTPEILPMQNLPFEADLKKGNVQEFSFANTYKTMSLLSLDIISPVSVSSNKSDMGEYIVSLSSKNIAKRALFDSKKTTPTPSTPPQYSSIPAISMTPASAVMDAIKNSMMALSMCDDASPPPTKFSSTVPLTSTIHRQRIRKNDQQLYARLKIGNNNNSSNYLHSASMVSTGLVPRTCLSRHPVLRDDGDARARRRHPYYRALSTVPETRYILANEDVVMDLSDASVSKITSFQENDGRCDDVEGTFSAALNGRIF